MSADVELLPRPGYALPPACVSCLGAPCGESLPVGPTGASPSVGSVQPPIPFPLCRRCHAALPAARRGFWLGALALGGGWGLVSALAALFVIGAGLDACVVSALVLVTWPVAFGLGGVIGRAALGGAGRQVEDSVRLVRWAVFPGGRGSMLLRFRHASFADELVRLQPDVARRVA